MEESFCNGSMRGGSLLVLAQRHTSFGCFKFLQACGKEDGAKEDHVELDTDLLLLLRSRFDPFDGIDICTTTSPAEHLRTKPVLVSLAVAKFKTSAWLFLSRHSGSTHEAAILLRTYTLPTHSSVCAPVRGVHVVVGVIGSQVSNVYDSSALREGLLLATPAGSVPADILWFSV